MNKSICLDRHPIPTSEEIACKLQGKCIFTVIDMKEGFYHIELDRKSIDLCTFVTPFGKYKFKRLHFVLACSPEVFQRVNEKIFGDLDVQIYFDDSIIAGSNELEHDKILEQVVERARKFNIKFNEHKLQYKVTQVKYLGQVYSKEGVKPDDAYVEAVLALY